jgi:hypothetical protein
MKAVFAALAVMAITTTSAEAKIHRSAAVTREFEREHHCPSTGKGHGPCPGYVKDHRIALCDGGRDSVANLHWQTIKAAKRKDRMECRSRKRR